MFVTTFVAHLDGREQTQWLHGAHLHNAGAAQVGTDCRLLQDAHVPTDHDSGGAAVDKQPLRPSHQACHHGLDQAD